MSNRAAMQQALEALYNMVEDGDRTDKQQAMLAITALRETLEQPAQEPVAYVRGTHAGRLIYDTINPAVCLPVGMALYTTQPAAEPPPEWELINNIITEYGLQAISFVAEWKAAQRPWQGLTWEDMPEEHAGDSNFLSGARWAEDKLKERNT
jgi:hypothetical protein